MFHRCVVRLTCVRAKSHVKRITKAQQRIIKTVSKINSSKTQRNDLIAKILPKPGPILENKFWKITGNMKSYKNTSNGVRHRRLATRFHLWKYGPIKRLSFGKRQTGGRNNTGKITVRGRGGGHKRRIRIIDFSRKIPGPHQVVRLEYDPNRSAHLALLRNLSTNQFSYIIQPRGVVDGTIVHSWASGIPEPAEGEEPIPKSRMIQPGNCLLLKDIPVGSTIHNIALKPGGPAKLCRSAGTSAQILFTAQTGHAQIRLSSKEVRLINVDCAATIGTVGNLEHHNRVLGKAGVSRRLGRRPKVRGIAQSPFSHPHGGGRKSKGNKHPRSPWGWKTKGWKTVRRKRSYILSSK